ncbi:MAG: hypothetical protein AB8G86_10000 [Saprospiraceae bacterium]
MLSPWTVTAKALSKYLLITKLIKMSVKNSLKFGMGLFLSLLLMVACQKEDVVENSKPIFSFDSNEEFSGFMDYLHQFEPEELDGLPELSSFYSHRNFYDEAELIDESELEAFNYNEENEIADPYLASVLNKEREILIGEIYYRLGNDYCFAFLSLEDKNIINEFKQKLKSGEINIPQRIKLQRKPISI